MGRIGTVKIVKGNGEIIEIPVFDVNQVMYPALRIALPSGVGAFNLVPPEISDIPIRVMTSQGIKGIGSTVGIWEAFISDDTYTSCSEVSVSRIDTPTYVGMSEVSVSRIDTPTYTSCSEVSVSRIDTPTYTEV